tara:strand:+ start:14667 stop:14933 length:267 start_codon:yes stop_codon:yes gene_type:complete
MLITELNKKFEEFYNEKSLEDSKLKSQEILEVLEEKGLDPFETVNGKNGIYVQAFEEYFSTFNLNPNPNKDGIEIMRILVMNTLKYEI